METKKLEVLVVEDSPKHLESAKKMREEGKYSVTITSTYKSAIATIADGQFDVVLTDLFIPWHTKAVDPLGRDHEKEARSPQPLGYPLAMIALGAGVPYVGIVTDANHHTGVMAATIDDLPTGKIKASYSIYDTSPQKIIGVDGCIPQLRMFYAANKDWSGAVEILTGKIQENITQSPYKVKLKRKSEYFFRKD